MAGLRLRKLLKKPPAVLRALLYALFGLSVFVLSLYLSLPLDRIKERLARELSQEPGPPPYGSGGWGAGTGMDVSIGELDVHLLSPGVSLTDMKLVPRRSGPASPPPGAEGAAGNGKDKKPLPMLIDLLDVRVGWLDLIAQRRAAQLRLKAFGGSLEGEGGLGDDGGFVNGKMEQIKIGLVSYLAQVLPLPMTGTLSGSVDVKVPALKPPPGAPPLTPESRRPGAGPRLDLPKAGGVIELQLAQGTLGDGKTKLVVPGDPFLSQGLTFPRLNLGTLQAKVVVDRGRAAIADLHTRSPDVELWIDGYIELREPVQLSELHLYVRFKPSQQLVQREPTIEILNNAMAVGKRADGAIGFAVTGSVALPRSRPAKEPPEGVTVRGGLGAVSPGATPALAPGAPSPTVAAPPTAGPPAPLPAAPPPPEPTPVAAPPPPPQQPPQEAAPQQPPPSSVPSGVTGAQPPPEPPGNPPTNYPSNQRGF